MRHVRHARIDDAQVDQRRGQSGRGADIDLLIRVAVEVGGAHLGDGDDRTRLGHAIPGKDVDAGRERLLRKRLCQRRSSDDHLQAGEIGFRRRRRVQHHLEDRRNAVREGHALGFDQLHQKGGIVAAGIDLLHSGERRRPGKPPGVHMEHRGDRHVDVVAREAALLAGDSEECELRKRMQHELPVAVVDALRQSGRAGRIESRRLRVLVEIRKGEVRRRRREKGLIFSDEGQTGSFRRRPVRHHDQTLHTRQARLQLLQKPSEIVVHEKRRRPRVIDRVGDLVVRKADVDGLQHGAHHRDCEERLEETVAVPVHYANGVARSDAGSGKRRGEAADAVANVAVGKALDVPVDDLLSSGLQ